MELTINLFKILIPFCRRMWSWPWSVRRCCEGVEHVCQPRGDSRHQPRVHRLAETKQLGHAPGRHRQNGRRLPVHLSNPRICSKVTNNCRVLNFCALMHYSLMPIRRHVPINSHASRYWKCHDPINRHTYKGICNTIALQYVGARLFLSTVPLEALQNYVLIQLIVTSRLIFWEKNRVK